jgi:hypothetical protein
VEARVVQRPQAIGDALDAVAALPAEAEKAKEPQADGETNGA